MRHAAFLSSGAMCHGARMSGLVERDGRYRAICFSFNGLWLPLILPCSSPLLFLFVLRPREVRYRRRPMAGVRIEQRIHE